MHTTKKRCTERRVVTLQCIHHKQLFYPFTIDTRKLFSKITVCLNVSFYLVFLFSTVLQAYLNNHFCYLTKEMRGRTRWSWKDKFTTLGCVSTLCILQDSRSLSYCIREGWNSLTFPSLRKRSLSRSLHFSRSVIVILSFSPVTSARSVRVADTSPVWNPDT